MNIDLQSVRERAGLSQTKLGAILGLSQAQVSRYEQEPGSISWELLIKWAQALGTDLTTLMASTVPPPPPLDAGDPYVQLRYNLNLLEQYINDAPPVGQLNIPNQLPTPDDLRKQLGRYRQKPNLVLVGRFDSGKSHLANTLMGGKFLPSQYQPATKVITFVRHIDDRPAWFDEQVCILAEDFWPKDEKENQIFDLTLLDSEGWCKKHCIKAGSLKVLCEHGVHNHLRDEDREEHSAVVYVNSPLLQSCNIVDFPGYSDKSDQTSKDVKKANSAVQIADLILYTSPVNGFMNAEDFSRLGYLLRVLPTLETDFNDFPKLGNLFIVATHAAPHIPDSQLESTLEIGGSRLYKQISSTILKERSERINCPITQEDLQKRFFAFWGETPNRWERLKNELVDVLGQYFPKARQAQIDREISTLKHKVTQQIAEQIKAYEQTKSEDEQVEQRQLELDQLEKDEPERLSQVKQDRCKTHQRISELRDQTKDSFQQTYSNMVHVAAVETMIRSHYKDKREAKEYAAGYLIEQLQSNLGAIINEKSDVLKIDIDNFLGTYEEVFFKLPKLNAGSVSIPFDPKGAFIGGLAGAGGVGALAVWAASLGNLGAYILVAKFVSILSVLGISISGGVATVVSFVATIGGPITLGIGLIAAAALMGWGLFGESWQRRLAKKIVSHVKEQQVFNKFLQGVDEYWGDTAKTFDKCADAVEEKFQSYIQHIRELCSNNTTSKERIESFLYILRELTDFFAGIPWKNPT
jgi:transcriptional regulator with XRE-family HTH domain/GTPase SAR1 family protein